jgi:hypothetical protein
LEHIASPEKVLNALIDFASDDALFLFEVPGFDGLVHKTRFDQIFHEHLQYFSLRTFRQLIANIGGHYIGFRENYHQWAALLVAFTKSAPSRKNEDPESASYRARDIHAAYEIFSSQAKRIGERLPALSKDAALYGYGAAQMLPVLAYHMNTQMAEFKAVIDDDPSRNGWYYQNLWPPILHSSTVTDLMQSTVLITAVDNMKPIMKRLLELRPRHIVTHLNVL